MIETCCLINVVTFIQTILSLVLSRKIINIYNDIAQRYGNVTVKDLHISSDESTLDQWNNEHSTNQQPKKSEKQGKD